MTAPCGVAATPDDAATQSACSQATERRNGDSTRRQPGRMTSRGQTVATHGLLDAMTTGGLGVEFFWPFSPARYFLPVRLIPVAPLGSGMLSPYGAAVLGVEAVFFLPAWLYASWPRRALSVETPV